MTPIDTITISIERLGRGVLEILRNIGQGGILLGGIVRRIPLVSKNLSLTIEQMHVLGVQTFPLVLTVAAFTGATVAMQAIYQFAGIIPNRFIGYAVRRSVFTEFAPVFTSILFSGRVATSIAAEIGNMKTNEQLDAMRVLGLDSVRYIYLPRVLACMLMLPVLVIFSAPMAVGISVFAVIGSTDMTVGQYLASIPRYFNISEVITGVTKTIFFGAAIGIVGVHYGLTAHRGAAGVGDATSKAIMACCAIILVLDFIVALAFM